MSKKQIENEAKIFIGPNRVERVEKQELQTPLGSEVLMVYYYPTKMKDGDKVKDVPIEPELMSKKMYDIIALDHQTDFNELRDLRTKNVIKEVIVLMSEWNLRYEEIPYIIGEISDINQYNIESATAFLYGVTNDNRTLLHTHKILTTHGKQPASKRENKS